MSDKTPVAMPAPYGQTMYGHRAPEELVNLAELLRAKLQGEDNQRYYTDPEAKEFDWETYFQGLIPKEKVEVRKHPTVAPTKGTQEYFEGLNKLECADDKDMVNNPHHYTAHEIEPIEYIMKNNLDFAEGSVVKYISRHHLKNGAEDVRKAIKFCEFILEFTYKVPVEK